MLPQRLQKLLGLDLLGSIEEQVRRILLDDHPFIHKQNLTGYLPGKVHFMRHDQHRHAFLSQLLHDLQDLADQLRIQGRGRFVKQNQLRLGGDRSGNPDALLLTAGKLMRIGHRPIPQPDLFQRLKSGFTFSNAVLLRNKL